MTITLQFKRGDTFLIEGRASSGGQPLDLSGGTVRSQVRNGAGLVSELSVQWMDQAQGIYRLRAEDTTRWPVAVLTCDIEYLLASGQKVSTETFEIDCIKDETR